MTNASPLVSVVIPSVDRRVLLEKAVRGALGQELDHPHEAIVVDNSADGRQSWILQALADAPVPGATATLRYVHEPLAGLVFSRNRGIREAQGDFIVFLDDDEEPGDRNWLKSLLDTADATGADVVFGPVTAAFEAPPQRFQNFIGTLYSRTLDRPDRADITDKAAQLGTGNSCFRRATCFEAGGLSFNAAFNRTGGEDIDLLFRLRRAGRRFAWAAGAPVREFVPDNRTLPDYLANRRLRQGQQRAYVPVASSPRRWHVLLFWMGVGALQTSYHAAAQGLARVAGQKERSELHGIKLWGGLGKVLWQSRFRQDHYRPRRSAKG